MGRARTREVSNGKSLRSPRAQIPPKKNSPRKKFPETPRAGLEPWASAMKKAQGPPGLNPENRKKFRRGKNLQPGPANSKGPAVLRSKQAWDEQQGTAVDTEQKCGPGCGARGCGAVGRAAVCCCPGPCARRLSCARTGGPGRGRLGKAENLPKVEIGKSTKPWITRTRATPQGRHWAWLPGTLRLCREARHSRCGVWCW